jgi:hypothetical protein
MAMFIMQLFLQLNIVDGKMQYMFDEDGRRYGVTWMLLVESQQFLVATAILILLKQWPIRQRGYSTPLFYISIMQLRILLRHWHPKCQVI